MVDSESHADANAVSRGVTLFMDRMMADPLLNWAYEHVDRPAIRRHALAFVVAALGGPDLYIGRGMHEAHGDLELRNEHFDAAVDHLVIALREAGISEGVISELAVRLEPLRSQIVTA